MSKNKVYQTLTEKIRSNQSGKNSFQDPVIEADIDNTEIGEDKLIGLSLRFCNISELPIEIGQFTDLRSIDLYHNRLEELPVEIFELNLTGLNLERNQISSLPDRFDKFAHLKSVNLQSNDLTSVPPSLLFHQNLEELDLSDNLISLPANALTKINPILNLTLPKYIILTDDAEFSSNQFSPLEKHHSRLYDGVHILYVENLETDEWISDRVYGVLQEADQIDFRTTFSEEKWKSKINNLMTSMDETIRGTGILLYDYLLSNKKLKAEISESGLFEKIESKVDDQISESKSNWKFFMYVFIGALMITVVQNYIQEIGLFTDLPIFELAILIYFGFQIYQGLTIKQYADNFIGRVESGTIVLQKSDKIPVLSTILKYIVTKFRSSLGVFIGIFWILSIVGLENTNIELEEFEFVVPILGLVSEGISTVPQYFSAFNIDFTFPQFVVISLALFQGFGGILLRVIGILTVFWAVYEGGWFVIIHPGEIEDRGKGARLDWYEILALPIGIFVAFVAIIVDNSSIAPLPIIVFQLGLFFGGILYFLYSKTDRIQMLLTILFLLTIGSLSYISLLPINFDSAIYLLNISPLSTERTAYIITIISCALGFGILLASNPNPDSIASEIDNYPVRLLITSVQGIIWIITLGVFYLIGALPLLQLLNNFINISFNQNLFLAYNLLIIIFLVIWYFPFPEDGLSFAKLLGRPSKDTRKGQTKSRWEIIASSCRFDKDRPGLITTSEKESKFDIIKKWDLGSIVFILTFYLFVPILLWRLLFYLPIYLTGIGLIIGFYITFSGGNKL